METIYSKVESIERVLEIFKNAPANSRKKIYLNYERNGTFAECFINEDQSKLIYRDKATNSPHDVFGGIERNATIVITD